MTERAAVSAFVSATLIMRLYARGPVQRLQKIGIKRGSLSVYLLSNFWEVAMSRALVQQLLGVIAVGVSVATPLAWAQETVRVRGTIDRVDGDTYVVKA